MYFPFMVDAWNGESHIPTREELFLVYQTLAPRRTGYDAMLWQTPALALMAQAFLMTLALAYESKPLVRLIAALLGLILSVLTMQLMARYRLFEKLDSLLLDRLEETLGLCSALQLRPHGRIYDRLHVDDSEKFSKRRRARWSREKASKQDSPSGCGITSYCVWQVGLASFGVTSLVIMGMVLLGSAQKAFGRWP